MGTGAGRNAVIKNIGLINPNVRSANGTYVGALIGKLEYAVISRCYAEGGNVEGVEEVGGLVGFGWYTNISKSYSSADVLGDEKVGGLVGWNGGRIRNCYSTGNVTGEIYVDGIVADPCSLPCYCFAMGTVISNQDMADGGVRPGNGKRGFWDIENDSVFLGGVGLYSYEMSDPNSFIEAGWDFVDETENGKEDIWMMGDAGHPILSWQAIKED